MANNIKNRIQIIGTQEQINAVVEKFSTTYERKPMRSHDGLLTYKTKEGSCGWLNEKTDEFTQRVANLQKISKPLPVEEEKLPQGMVKYKYGAMSSLYSLLAENKFTAYVTMVAHYNRNAHLISIESPAECEKDSWINLSGKISDRLDEIFGGKDSFDKYAEENKEAIKACYKTIKQIC